MACAQPVTAAADVKSLAINKAFQEQAWRLGSYKQRTHTVDYYYSGNFFFLGINPLQNISFENKNVTTHFVSMDHHQSSCFASDFLETVPDPLKQESAVIPAIRVTSCFRKRDASGNTPGTRSIARVHTGAVDGRQACKESYKELAVEPLDFKSC